MSRWWWWWWSIQIKWRNRLIFTIISYVESYGRRISALMWDRTHGRHFAIHFRCFLSSPCQAHVCALGSRRRVSFTRHGSLIKNGFSHLSSVCAASESSSRARPYYAKWNHRDNFSQHGKMPCDSRWEHHNKSAETVHQFGFSFFGQ